MCDKLSTFVKKRMNIYKFFLLVILVFAFSLSYGETRNANALVWRIINQKTQDTSYIMATCHAEHISIIKHISGFDEAWERTSTIAFESDLLGMQKVFYDTRQMNEVVDSSMYVRILGKDKYGMLKEKLPDVKLNINPIKLKKMLEYNLYMVIYSGFLFNKENRINVYNSSFEFGKKDSTYNNMTLECYAENFLDLGLQKKCISENKEMVFLNSKADDAEQLAQGKTECDSCVIRDAINDLFDMVSNTRKYFESAWKLDTIYYNHELLKLQSKDTPIKVHDMNKRWAASIRNLLQNGDVLFVVGARHLVHCGKEKGLLNRIKKMGYKIEPIEYKPNK